MFPPEIDDPLRPLVFAIEQARAAQRMSKIINTIKRVDETDEQAMIRLVHERLALAKILDRLGVFAAQFDLSHRNTNVVEELTMRIFSKNGQITK